MRPVPATSATAARWPGPRPGSPATLRIEAAEKVGNWGLNIDWNDGHGTGIYTWDVLPRLVPVRGLRVLMTEAVPRGLVGDGLRAVAEWEDEHGRLMESELDAARRRVAREPRRGRPRTARNELGARPAGGHLANQMATPVRVRRP